MVLVTSANGRVGRQVVRELVKRGFIVRAADINPAAESLQELGVSEVFIGDARKPEFVRRAMAGVEQVVYVPPLFVYDETDIANLAADEALAAGVTQFVQLSVTHINLTGLLQHVKKQKARSALGSDEHGCMSGGSSQKNGRYRSSILIPRESSRTIIKRAYSCKQWTSSNVLLLFMATHVIIDV